MGIFPILGALAGLFQIIDTLGSAESAPQQAAGMAMACAYAIVPYVFARGVEMLRGGSPSGIPPVPTGEPETAIASELNDKGDSTTDSTNSSPMPTSQARRSSTHQW